MIETESGMVVARDRGEGRMASYYLMKVEFQLYKVKRVLETDGVDRCTSL